MKMLLSFSNASIHFYCTNNIKSKFKKSPVYNKIISIREHELYRNIYIQKLVHKIKLLCKSHSEKNVMVDLLVSKSYVYDSINKKCIQYMLNKWQLNTFN